MLSALRADQKVIETGIIGRYCSQHEQTCPGLTWKLYRINSCRQTEVSPAITLTKTNKAKWVSQQPKITDNAVITVTKQNIIEENVDVEAF